MFILHVLDEFYPCLTTSLEVGCNLKSGISMMQDPWGSALIQTRVIPSRIFRNIPHKNIQKYFQMSSQKQIWLSMYLIKRKSNFLYSDTPCIIPQWNTILYFGVKVMLVTILCWLHFCIFYQNLGKFPNWC